MRRQRSDRLPIGPLRALLARIIEQEGNIATAAELLAVPEQLLKDLFREDRHAVSVYTVDVLCIRLGKHPIEVYGAPAWIGGDEAAA